MRHAFLIAAPLVVLLTAPLAHATRYVPPHLLVERPGTPAVLEQWVPPGITPADITARLSKIASFEKSMQYLGSCDAGAEGADAGAQGDGACEYGGIIEVQSGPGHAIIESDNTQEAVWIWSWDKQLNGETQYAPQITNAFQFLSVFPGWLKWEETGDPGPDYYSIYNCGWGVRAVVEYEAAWGDMSHHAYGTMCAEHIATYAKTIAQTGTLINVATASWAASGLWIWGTAENDASMQAQAVAIGTVAKAWIDAQPSRVSSQTWAVTGAAVYDGVIHSYMEANPSELSAWVQATAPKLGGWIDESQPVSPEDWTDWRNAHNAWNMLAQFDTGTVLGEGATGPHNATAVSIYGKIVAQDTQDNGGIPGSQQLDNSMEDETWITAYFAYFGMRPLLADMELDAGAPDSGAAPDGSAGDATPLIPGDASTPTHASSSSGSKGCNEGGADTAWPVGLPALAVALAWGLSRRRRPTPTPR
jgi:MYXO-CTERM domain-containing protein